MVYVQFLLMISLVQTKIIFIVKIVLEMKGFHYFQHFRHQKALLHFRSQLGEEHSFCVISKFNLISKKMRKMLLMYLESKDESKIGIYLTRVLVTIFVLTL